MSYGASKASQYAIRALVHLATRPAAENVPVRVIAEATDIPHHFLAKLVQVLVRDGFVRALKGPGGGLHLARPPREINVSEVIESIDGRAFFEGCFLGLGACGEEAPCPMHDEWKVLRSRLLRDLERISIAQLARTARDPV